jgi:hypothetical protein
MLARYMCQADFVQRCVPKACMSSEACAVFRSYAAYVAGYTLRQKSYLLAAPVDAAVEAADLIGIVWRFGRGMVVCDWD